MVTVLGSYGQARVFTEEDPCADSQIDRSSGGTHRARIAADAMCDKTASPLCDSYKSQLAMPVTGVQKPLTVAFWGMLLKDLTGSLLLCKQRMVSQG